MRHGSLSLGFGLCRRLKLIALLPEDNVIVARMELNAHNGRMKSTKQEVNKLVNAAMQAGNLPAGGAYSTGATLESLSKDLAVEWDGNVARLSLGFVLKNSGLTSIFLMYGTPKMRPVDGLYDILRGPKARTISRKEQEAAILKILERLGG